ncbi:FAD binding domain-containing protein [Candidatus Formimonas warabiya]|uniref:FAD-binding PCMH-type domain-containing protein n=1 Tax=Formimonas warabiya TaxID=1761012 RepID=A0A3G1KXK5_FORW1|nr:xanthine dehydrogenase family protein subunit M [Candidatus Formimonas warabiya]ATW27150.1 hypothetical protein DCMF_22525 [Candidatus Formimonas warabiya]
MQRLTKFEYVFPQNLTEAFVILKEEGAGAKILAGGTDVLVAIKEKGLKPAVLVDLKGLSELKGIKVNEDGSVEIGALTTLHEVEMSPLIRKNYSALADAAGYVGSYPVRNRATLGGNVCNAAPSADTSPALIAFQAKANIVGPEGSRSIALEEFFTGPGKSVLQPGELLASFSLPAADARMGGAYLKHGPREAMDIAIAGVAATVLMDEQGICRQARIVMGAVASTPLRAKTAEEILVGQKISTDLIAKAGEIAGGEARPISDLRSSADYRRKMVIVLTRRALHEALSKIS